MRPYILCQGAARDVFGGLDVATDEAASVVLKIQNGSLNEEAVVPKDDEKDDDRLVFFFPLNDFIFPRGVFVSPLI